jgi:hypothetical protein
MSRDPAVDVQAFINQHPLSHFQRRAFATRFVIASSPASDSRGH